MITIMVESYAGSRAEEHPLRFYLQDRKLEIHRIEKRWLSPGRRCFKVLADDGNIYILEYDEIKDSWNILTTDRP